MIRRTMLIFGVRLKGSGGEIGGLGDFGVVSCGLACLVRFRRVTFYHLVVFVGLRRSSGGFLVRGRGRGNLLRRRRCRLIRLTSNGLRLRICFHCISF
jgi:hypothetical protein